jgi:nucleoid DNA-binding protein
MTLTKDEIVKALAKENVFQKMRSIEIIETLLEIIKSKLTSGEDMSWSAASENSASRKSMNEKAEIRQLERT